jgi:hypothetical protein
MTEGFNMAKIKVKVIMPFSDGVNGYKFGQVIEVDESIFSADRMVKIEAEKPEKAEKKATKKG